jgi:hypothetical protein
MSFMPAFGSVAVLLLPPLVEEDEQPARQAVETSTAERRRLLTALRIGDSIRVKKFRRKRHLSRRNG